MVLAPLRSRPKQVQCLVAECDPPKGSYLSTLLWAVVAVPTPLQKAPQPTIAAPLTTAEPR